MTLDRSPRDLTRRGFQRWFWVGAALLLLVGGSAGGMEVVASIEEIAQTADLVFVGTVTSVTVRTDDEKPVVASEV